MRRHCPPMPPNSHPGQVCILSCFTCLLARYFVEIEEMLMRCEGDDDDGKLLEGHFTVEERRTRNMFDQEEKSGDEMR